MPRGNSSVASTPKAVVALGNPDRADDGVGVAVLAELAPQGQAEMFVATKTGFDLAFALSSYKEVLLLDATPLLLPGEVRLFSLDDLGASGFGLWSPHEMGLDQAFKALAQAGVSVPKVWVLAIGVPQDLPFRRGLSPEVAEAVPKAKEVMKRWLES